MPLPVFMMNNERITGKDVKYAREVLGILSDLSSQTYVSIDIPTSLIDYVENVLEEHMMEGVHRAREINPSTILRDRSEYYPITGFGSAYPWNKGISLEDILPQIEAEELAWHEGSINLDFKSVTPSKAYSGLLGRQLEDRILSGHLNRIFPLKLSMRVLMNLYLNRTKYLTEAPGDYFDPDDEAFDSISAQDFRKVALNVAEYAREWFLSVDKFANMTRGAEWTTGLPERDGKSGDRFMAQFVASISKKSSSFLEQLGFIYVDEEGDVHFTQEGWTFAKYRSHLVDYSADSVLPESILANDEIIFLKHHIKTCLPKEFQFCRSIIDLIEDGHNTPKKLQAELVKSFGIAEESVNLLSNGAIGRLQDMMIVDRVKTGRKVTYEVKNSHIWN